MRSNAKIIFQKERRYQHTTAGAIYSFTIYNDTIFDRLVELGVTERKSLIIIFPDTPEPYVRHFIRGCWDGDGSIGKHNKNSYHARFFSGSKVFVAGMLAELEKAGFPSRRIYSRNMEKYFWFSYVGKIVGKLHIYLYEDVPTSMRYERKYLIFRKAFEKCSTDQMKLALYHTI
jgi:DNA-binding transcriptional regulator WhiA